MLEVTENNSQGINNLLVGVDGKMEKDNKDKFELVISYFNLSFCKNKKWCNLLETAPWGWGWAE